MINIGNKTLPETITAEHSYYVGRPSPLGNPFPIKKSKFSTKIYSLEESLDLYKKWLWNELKNKGAKSDATKALVALAKLSKTEDITLVCWCVDENENGACHAKIIRGAIQWLNNGKKY